MFIQDLAIYALLRSQICTHPATFSETSSQLTASTWAKLKREPSLIIQEWTKQPGVVSSPCPELGCRFGMGLGYVGMTGAPQWHILRCRNFASTACPRCTSWPRWRHLFSEKAVDWCFFFAFWLAFGWCPVFAWFWKGFTANSSWQFLTFKAST